jgi:hypothetical protein
MCPRCDPRGGRGGVHREPQRQVQGPLPGPDGPTAVQDLHAQVDADRFARDVDVDVDKDRGSWIEPRTSEISLQAWAETLLAGSLPLSPTSLATYRRDLELYVLPALGDRRLSRLNAEEIEQ